MKSLQHPENYRGGRVIDAENRNVLIVSLGGSPLFPTTASRVFAFVLMAPLRWHYSYCVRRIRKLLSLRKCLTGTTETDWFAMACVAQTLLSSTD